MEESIKKLLKDYTSVCHKIKNSEINLKYYMELIEASRELAGISYEGVSVQTSNVSNITAETAERIEQFGLEINRNEICLSKLYDQRYVVDTLMLTLDADDREIIDLRYFRRMRWRAIAKMVNYSRSQAIRRCDKALSHMTKTIRASNDLKSKIRGVSNV